MIGALKLDLIRSRETARRVQKTMIEIPFIVESGQLERRRRQQQVSKGAHFLDVYIGI